jgi:toxin ParE1/3/4
MKVGFTRHALKQLDDILAHLETDSPGAATRLASRLEAQLSLIVRHPDIGRPTNLRNVRVFRAAPFPYLIFYRIALDRAEITILRMRHTAREGDWRQGR